MSPGFSPERIAAIEPGIAELAASHAAGWPLLRPFRLLEAMRSLCTEVTVRVVLSVSDPRRSVLLVDAIRRMLNTPGNPPLPLPGGDDGPGGVAGWAGDAIFVRRAALVRDLLLEQCTNGGSSANPATTCSARWFARPRLTTRRSSTSC